MISHTSSCQSSKPWGCRDFSLTTAHNSSEISSSTEHVVVSELQLRPVFMHSQLWKWTTRWSQLIARPAGHNASLFAANRWQPPQVCYTQLQKQDLQSHTASQLSTWPDWRKICRCQHSQNHSTEIHGVLFPIKACAVTSEKLPSTLVVILSYSCLLLSLATQVPMPCPSGMTTKVCGVRVVRCTRHAAHDPRQDPLGALRSSCSP